ncbi:unnamed protein product [Pelagomonas calceolata]|uniref:Uncharacterized protein n=2 Tax=Pelagomonas calceolata TaxID=35677 RepID=A0A8J2SRZ7_9STRA|nr:unnamed protein product [Pelagomonas calceolata]
MAAETVVDAPPAAADAPEAPAPGPAAPVPLSAADDALAAATAANQARAPAQPRSDDESDESPPPTRKRKASDADASPPTDGAGLALEDVVQKLTADIATVREERAESEARLLQAIADLAKKPREEGSGLGESSSQKRRGSSSSKSSRSHEGDALSSDDDARDHAGHVRRSVQAALSAGAGNVQYNHFASGSNVTLLRQRVIRERRLHGRFERSGLEGVPLLNILADKSKQGVDVLVRISNLRKRRSRAGDESVETYRISSVFDRRDLLRG